MPRYIVERSWPEAFGLQTDSEGAEACLSVVGINADHGVTWLHSYFSDDKRKSFCVYDGPDPEAIRRAADRAELPIDRISRVRVLDPYFYQ